MLLDTPFTTDLLTLSNDIATLVEDETVPGGTYSQIRFIIPEACIGVEQADETELVYASGDLDECGPKDGQRHRRRADGGGRCEAPGRAHASSSDGPTV